MMSHRDGSAWRSDGGVAVVEVAFALPILLTFIFALVDLGMWTLNVNQATNAARDGARAGILGPVGADVPGSDAEQVILAAVQAHLDRDVESVEIACVDPSGTPLASCAAAQVDVDRMRVQVEWDWTLLTPLAVILGYDQGRAHGSATMTILGSPVAGSAVSSTTTSTTTTTSPDPATCGTTLTVSPSTVATTGRGASQLREAVTVAFTTNGSTSCNDLRIELYSSHSDKRVESISCGCGEGPTTFSWSYVGSANAWKPGSGTVNLYNGATLLASETFAVVEGSE